MNGGVNHMPSASKLVLEVFCGYIGLFNVVLLVTTRSESGFFGQQISISPCLRPLIAPDRYRDDRSRVNSHE